MPPGEAHATRKRRAETDDVDDDEAKGITTNGEDDQAETSQVNGGNSSSTKKRSSKRKRVRIADSKGDEGPDDDEDSNAAVSAKAMRPLRKDGMPLVALHRRRRALMSELSEVNASIQEKERSIIALIKDIGVENGKFRLKDARISLATVSRVMPLHQSAIRKRLESTLGDAAEARRVYTAVYQTDRKSKVTEKVAVVFDEPSA